MLCLYVALSPRIIAKPQQINGTNTVGIVKIAITNRIKPPITLEYISPNGPSSNVKKKLAKRDFLFKFILFLRCLTYRL